MSGVYADWIGKILIAIFSASIGAFLGSWLTLRREKRKAEMERLGNAREACLGLQELLAAWYHAIEEAVYFEESGPKTVEKLRRFMHGLRFESQLNRQLLRLMDEPLCKDLEVKAGIFREVALEGKGDLKVRLEAEFPRKYYDIDRDKVLRLLKNRFADFERELEKVNKLLQEKKRQLS